MQKIPDHVGTEWGKRKWKMRDGTKIRWRDMEVSHLRNCANMLRRVAEQEESAAWSVASMCQGDMSSYYADQEASYASDRALVRNEKADQMESYANWRSLFPNLGEGVFHV
jgi:hypothetical protein